MSETSKLVTVAALALGLSGCVASVSPVEVTRFHNQVAGQQIARGDIALVPVADIDINDLEYRTYSAAVFRELQKLGYSDGADSEAPFEARIGYDRDTVEALARRSPVSVGVGGSTGSYGSGIGLGIGINLSGKPKNRIQTELTVSIRQRSDNQVVWEGRALTEGKAGSPSAQPGIAAAKLAESLFKGFPGESGRTITVK